MSADESERPSEASGRIAGQNSYLASFPARPLQLERNRIYSVGRAEGNNIILADADVSRHHAVITGNGEHFVLKDLGSRNGSFVNRERIEEPRILNPDDRITIGNRVFSFIVATERDVRLLHEKMQGETKEDETEILDMDMRAAPGQGFAGSLSDFGLPELIQTLEMNQKTGVLTIVSDEGRGTITVCDGDLIAAELGETTGEEAVYSLLDLNDGFFEFEAAALVASSVEIQISSNALLMEAFRRQDEKRSGRFHAEPPDQAAVRDE